MLRVLLLALALVARASLESVWVCACGDAAFLGEYRAAGEMDGAARFENGHRRSLFRSNGFWYLGDLHSWPVETHYRCVGHEDCPYKRPSPPAPGKWTLNKFVGRAPAPALSLQPCDAEPEL